MCEQDVADFIWRTRYRDGEACPPEATLADTFKRVAASVAAVERDQAPWAERYFEALRGLRFLPGGRILAGAGTHRHVTLFNCFVMGLINDSLDGIFESLKEGALTMQQGGGVGYDFSTLRPRGAHARTTGTIASGPVSFMRVWDAMCATLLSTGARRGAMMATLRCDHPDIEEFIDAKRRTGSLPRFNLSVLATDAFMEAVANDADWPLVFPAPEEAGDTLERVWSGHREPVRCRIHKTIAAKRLWSQLCDSAYDCAEPGILYIDRINAENNLGYCETLSATNPCAEEPLPPFGACNLGSLNLTAFVREAFTPLARLDRVALQEATGVGVRFLDGVIEVSRYPLERQRSQVHRARRLGLGMTGLADALAMLGLRYDSVAGRELAADAMCAIRDAAYTASIELARERGPFPAFEASRYLEQPFIHRLPGEIRARIARHGIRNSHLLAVAPTGTISLLAGNLSSGIEPIFGLESLRHVLDGTGRRHEFRVLDHAYAAWRATQPTGRSPPEEFLESRAISPHDHLLMQAAIQPYVDGAISKTVTLSRSLPRATVPEIFREAYDLHLKGCTIFREGSREEVIAEISTSTEPGAECDAYRCGIERESD